MGKDARRCRKALGGGMRQAGIIAAAGRTFIDVDMDSVETNMVMLRVKLETGLTPCTLTERMARTTPQEIEEIGKEIRLLAYPMTAKNVRLVVHCNMTSEDVELAAQKLRYVLQEFSQQVKEQEE